jgi:hypothetical protein
MSGTAGLSAAKNRRSGNEVKFSGQPKQPIPPQHSYQNMQHSAPHQRGGQQQQPIPPQSQQIQPPHPLVLLKSHEIRLQKIESAMTSDCEATPDEFYNLLQDFVAHKEDYELFKTSVKLDATTSMQATRAMAPFRGMQPDTSSQNDKDRQLQFEKISNLEGDILVLHRRIDEMYRLINTLTIDVTCVKEQSTCKCKCNSSVLPSSVLPSVLPSSVLPSSVLPSLELISSDLPSSDLPSSELPSSDLPSSDLPSSDLTFSDLPSSDLPSSDLPITLYSKTTEPNIQFEILDSCNTTAL